MEACLGLLKGRRSSTLGRKPCVATERESTVHLRWYVVTIQPGMLSNTVLSSLCNVWPPHKTGVARRVLWTIGDGRHPLGECCKSSFSIWRLGTNASLSQVTLMPVIEGQDDFRTVSTILFFFFPFSSWLWLVHFYSHDVPSMTVNVLRP